MGDYITFCARFSDNTVASAYVDATFCKCYILSAKCIDERYMTHLLKTHGYYDENPRTTSNPQISKDHLPIVPNVYGITYIDYITKEIVSYNDCCDVLRLDSFFLGNQYEALSVTGNLHSEKALDKDTALLRAKELESSGQSFRELRFLCEVLNYTPQVYLRDELIEYDERDLNSILSKIYGVDLMTGWNDMIKSTTQEYSINNGGISDLSFKVDDWKVDDSIVNRQSIKDLYTLLNNRIILTDSEKRMWDI